MSELTLDVSGPAAPPRSNGELVFEAPWEGRAFGMVMALCDRKVIEWSHFRELLIDEIGLWEKRPPPKSEWNYYRCWLTALERVLTDDQLLMKDDIEALFEAFQDRPHGHDH